MKTKDNRASIGKTLRGGDLRQLPELLLSPPVNRNHARDMAEIYWLHGCPDEAASLMQAPSFRNPFLAVTLIAKRDAERLNSIAEHPNTDDFWKNRFSANATLLDGSQNPQAVLSNYRDFLINYPKSDNRQTPPSDLVGVQYALAILSNNPDRQPPPSLSSAENTFELSDIRQAWKSMATFLALIEACGQTQKMRHDLLALPSNSNDYTWRTEIEAIDVYCQTDKRES